MATQDYFSRRRRSGPQTMMIAHLREFQGHDKAAATAGTNGYNVIAISQQDNKCHPPKPPTDKCQN